MEEFFFLIFFILFLLIWLILLKYSGVKILTISILSFLIISILTFQYLGYPSLFFFLDDDRAEFVQDRNVILKMFFITSYTITLIILGFIIARKIFGPLHLKNQHNPFSSAIIQDRQLSRFILYLFFILSLLVLFIYISKIGFNNIPLLLVFNFTENNLSIEALRSNMGNAFEGKYHWYQLFMRDFLSITSVAFFGFYLLRKNLFYFLIFIISFFICCFSMTMAIEKAPLLFYLISLFLLYVLIKNNGQFKIKQIINFGLFGLLLISLMYVIFMNSSNIVEGLKNVFPRIFTGSVVPLYHYLEIFPEKVDFLWGRSFPNPGGLLLFEPYNLTQEVHDLIFPYFKEQGIVGSMPTIFWGEMYANFGYMGVIIPPFFIGFFLYGLNILLYRLPMTPFFFSVYIWIILHYKNITVTSLSGFIIDTNIFIVILLLIFVISAPKTFKFKYIKFRNLKNNLSQKKKFN